MIRRARKGNDKNRIFGEICLFLKLELNMKISNAQHQLLRKSKINNDKCRNLEFNFKVLF